MRTDKPYSLHALFVGRGRRDALVLIFGGLLAVSGLWNAAKRETGWGHAIALAVMVTLYLFVPWLKPLRERQDAAHREKVYGKVTVDDWGVTRVCGKVREAVAWSDVAWVAIETTDQGPWAEDFFYLLCSVDGKGVVVPNFLAIELNLVDTMHDRLPGVDYRQAAVAIGSTSNAIFKIWDRSDPPPRKPSSLANRLN